MPTDVNSTLSRVLVVCGLAWTLALAPLWAAQGEPGAAQTSMAGGVTVKVTPSNISAASDVWSFAVVLDTHSQDLSDDLMNSAVLVGDDGGELRPQSWKGSPAGGHHREGTLEFAAPKPESKSVVLMLRRPGESEPRVFRWAR